jgi:hypothetical protein
MVYRLLFMFYIEARPELGYVPIAKSEVYLKGYSLESLRDLELQPLNTPACARRPLLRRHPAPPFQAGGTGLRPGRRAGSVNRNSRPSLAPRTPSQLAPLDSRLFDDASMPLLDKVRFPNHVWQQVIR